MKTIKRLLHSAIKRSTGHFCIAFAALVVSSFVANAQSEQWKTYLDICKQFSTDMTPCEKMKVYARMDSLFDGYIPVRQQEMNYMEAALQCGDTATFKKMAFRVVSGRGGTRLCSTTQTNTSF